MNTLGDTDEGRARPSVWPVYVMSAIIGLFSLIGLGWVWLVPWMAQMPAEIYQQLDAGPQGFVRLMQRLAPYAPVFGLHGLFGIVTAVAAVRLRAWGWWCAVAWVGAYSLWHAFVAANIGIAEASLTASLITVAFYGLIIWTLATRRRLFFPRE